MNERRSYLKTGIGIISFLLILTSGFVMAEAGMSDIIGGDQGWYIFHCHADGAVVYLDNDEKGVIQDDELSVPVYTTGTPYSTYTVTYDTENFHQSVTRSLPAIPTKGGTVNIYVDISPIPTPVPTPEPKPVGGDEGWYDIYCNVNGATVSFDGEDKGTIESHMLSVPVYTTGTPYQTVTVSAPGYDSYTEDLTRHPAKGETVDIYITLNRDQTVPMIES